MSLLPCYTTSLQSTLASSCFITPQSSRIQFCPDFTITPLASQSNYLTLYPWFFNIGTPKTLIGPPLWVPSLCRQYYQIDCIFRKTVK